MMDAAILGLAATRQQAGGPHRSGVFWDAFIQCRASKILEVGCGTGVITR